MSLPPTFRRRLARWRRVATASRTGVSAICIGFGALVFAGFYAAKEHSAIFQSVRPSEAGGFAGAAASGGMTAVGLIAELSPDDPVMRFYDTRIGHVLVQSARGDNCQRLLFDNRTGAYFSAPDVFCGLKPGQTLSSDGPNRMDAVRKSFQR